LKRILADFREFLERSAGVSETNVFEQGLNHWQSIFQSSITEICFEKTVR